MGCGGVVDKGMEICKTQMAEDILNHRWIRYHIVISHHSSSDELQLR